MIRRLQAQRACLDWATAAIAELPGPVLELGLGNGRTYHHLRERLGDREIFVFDLEVNAHPDCVPDHDHLFLGDIQETLPRVADQLGRTAALVHSDIGTGDVSRNAQLAAQIAPLIAALIRPEGLIVSDQELPLSETWREIPTPEGVAPGRYHLYRADR